MMTRRRSLAVLVLAALAGPGLALRPAAAQGAKRMEDPSERPAKARATEPAEKPAKARATEPPSAGPVNINRADVAELMTLSGVGRKVAERIVAYRTEHGPFKAPDDIKKVEGVGPGLWEKNRARIVVR